MHGSATRELTYKERLNWLRLFRSENIGPIAFQKLLQRYGSAETALEALPEITKSSGKKRTPQIISLSTIEAEMEAVQRIGARMIALPEADYPALLRNIPDPPPIITILGQIELLQKSAIAMVGARNASTNGSRLAYNIAQELAQKGIIIVSGMARGIDTAAHSGATPSHTIAVLAGGIDNIYPRENHELYAAISQTGCLVSEMPLGTTPQARHFPRRNRIVSGLALGTVVVEATIRSGSLITSRFAVEQGREVMAIPGSPCDSRASGPNSLIKDGAILIESASDIQNVLENMSYPDHSMPLFSHCTETLLKPDKILPHTNSLPPETSRKKQSRVMELLTTTPLEIDHLLRDSGLSAAEGAVVLLELELSGQIERLSGQMVARILN